MITSLHVPTLAAVSAANLTPTPSNVIILSQSLIAVVEFFLINWLGKHSISSGYHSISFIQNGEESPLFNVVFRILAPTIFLILAAAALYAAHLDPLVDGFWRVTVIYFVLRWTFNVAMGRRILLRWTTQYAVASLAIALSYVVYHQILVDRTIVLPSARGLTDELWIVVIIFIYHTYRQVTSRTGSESTERRRSKYLQAQYAHFLPQFGEVIRSEASSRNVEALAFAILLYENFNRPAAYRFLEKWALHPLGLARSLGPMQVPSADYLSDRDLVALAVRKLSRDFASAIEDEASKNPSAGELVSTDAKSEGGETRNRKSALDAIFGKFPRWTQERIYERAAGKYNARSDYPGQVLGILRYLKEHYYPTALADSY